MPAVETDSTGRTWSCWPWSCSRRSRPVQRRPLWAMVTPTSRSCLRSYQPRSLGPTIGDVACRARVVLDDPQQLGQGVGLGGAVVVQQPQPLHGLAVGQLRHVVRVVAPGAGDRVPAAGALEVRQVVRGEHAGGAGGLVDGLAEAGAAGEVQHPVVAEGLGEQPGGVVRAAGVGRHGVLHGAFLAEQPGEGVGQPAGAVVGDEHGGDDVPRELGWWQRCRG